MPNFRSPCSLLLSAICLVGPAYAVTHEKDPVSRWALQLKERRGFARATVAIAAKNARMCWAMLRLEDQFKLPA